MPEMKLKQKNIITDDICNKKQIVYSLLLSPLHLVVFGLQTTSLKILK
jgi:hypothetical protein